MIGTHPQQAMNAQAVLYLAFELGWTEWKLGFSTGIAGAPRLRTMRARDLAALRDEIARAKKRCGLPEETSVYSCDEAGRDGCWRHRSLTAQGIHNLVVDSASIEVQTPRAAHKDGPARCQHIAHYADPPLPW